MFFKVARWPAWVLGLLLCLLAPLAAAAAPRMVSAAVDELSLRTGPGTRYEALWTVVKGYPLKVLSKRGNWLKVSDFENDKAWVYAPMTGKTAHHVVKAQRANLRRSPTTGSAIVAKLQYGDVLRTLERRGSWLKVRLASGATGWIAKRLVWGW
jgi:SH3-like domain-containing protein